MPLTTPAHDTAWMRHASCIDAPADFVPQSEDHTTVDYLTRQYCDLCPVRVACLRTAIVTSSEGIWGGTTTFQRRQLVRVRNRAKCPLCLSVSLIQVEDDDVCRSCAASWPADRRPQPAPKAPAWDAPQAEDVAVVISGAL